MQIYIIGAAICLLLLLQLSDRYATADDRTDSYIISLACVLMAVFWPIVLPTVLGAFILLPRDPDD